MNKIMTVKIVLVIFLLLGAWAGTAMAYSIEDLQDKFDDEFSVFADENGIIDASPYFIGIDEVNETKIGDKYIYHKNKIWDYEKEWRVWFEETEKVKQEFTDYDVYSKEIEAVYFGCHTSDENRAKIIKLAREVNPEVTFFQGSKAQDRFGIVFDRI